MKAAYNRNRQHIQLISNTAAATPTDIWKLADDFIKPIISDQFSLGYFRNFQDNTYETSLEVYYKQMQNLVDYKNGAVVIMNDKLSADLLNGKGKAYGAEIMVRKNKGKLNGWIGYTYARSFIKSPSPFSEVAINNGNYYPAAYDKPHDITASLNYKFSRRWSMSGNFTYSTGRPVTLPEYSFSADGRDLVYFSERNKYRIPDYHRFDLAITYHGHLKREQRFKTSWTLSVYNLYGRSNPYSVYYTKDQPTAANNYQDYVLYRMAVVDRPIPTLTFNFDF